jgi:ABC-type transport system involved in multi-copper enzyme maturation permease subunit
MIFLFFFFGQYLLRYLGSQLNEQTITLSPTSRIRVNPAEMLAYFQTQLKVNGSGETYRNVIWYEGFVVMIVLALAGSVLVGNDFAHGSLPFYLSKPIGRWHYVLGKCLAIGVFVNLATTIPAVVLWVEAGLLYDWKTYYLDHLDLLAGVLGYGLILTVSLSLLVVATAVWVRKTVPMVMVWMGVFALLRMLAGWLVDGLKVDERWRLIDLWNDLYLCGLWCLGAEPQTIRPQPQPAFWQAAAVVGGVCAGCVLYLRKRVQAVEIVA